VLPVDNDENNFPIFCLAHCLPHQVA